MYATGRALMANMLDDIVTQITTTVDPESGVPLWEEVSTNKATDGYVLKSTHQVDGVNIFTGIQLIYDENRQSSAVRGIVAENYVPGTTEGESGTFTERYYDNLVPSHNYWGGDWGYINIAYSSKHIDFVEYIYHVRWDKETIVVAFVPTFVVDNMNKRPFADFLYLGKVGVENKSVEHNEKFYTVMGSNNNLHPTHTYTLANKMATPYSNTLMRYTLGALDGEGNRINKVVNRDVFLTPLFLMTWENHEYVGRFKWLKIPVSHETYSGYYKNVYRAGEVVQINGKNYLFMPHKDTYWYHYSNGHSRNTYSYHFVKGAVTFLELE